MERKTAREKVLTDSFQLNNIFEYLDLNSVKNVRIVTKQWRSVTSDDARSLRFWVKSRLRVNDDNISEVMQSSVSKLVPQIDIAWFFGHFVNNFGKFERLLRAVAAGEFSHLKKISVMCSQQPTFSDPELLSQVMVRLEELDVRKSNLSTDQLRALLDTVLKAEDLRLKRLFIYDLENLPEVPENIRMEAAVKLEETDLQTSFASKESLIEWFDFIAESPVMNLRSLTTCGIASEILPEVLAAALVRAENVRAKFLSEDAHIALFKKITNTDDIKLRQLVINYSDLSHVPPDILEETLVTLEEIDLSVTNLTPEQVQGIFDKISTCENLKLRKLMVKGNNLSSVPAPHLVQAISRLEEIDLDKTHLHHQDQVIPIFTLLAERKSSKVLKIRLENNCVDSVPSELIEQMNMNSSVDCYYDNWDIWWKEY